MNAGETKKLVREKYGAIARGEDGCCGSRTAASAHCCVGEAYERVEGYVPEADLGLGCGLPTEHAGIEPGMTVLDLGSGAGNDVFVAARLVGEGGRVIGVDFTPQMLEKAESNRQRLGLAHVEFREGEIERLPVADGSVDVVISNCVLNLVPDKGRAFREIARVLRPGGHFCVSDIVVTGALPPELRQAAEMYVGCVAGALSKDEYLEVIARAGFASVEVRREREVRFSDEALREYLSEAGLGAFRRSGARILSVTVRGTLPAAARGAGSED